MKGTEMVADPRWLEILKSSGGQAAAVAAACVLFLLADRHGWMPKAEPWMIHAATFGLLLGGALAVVALASAANKFFPVKKWILHWIKIRRERKWAEEYLPHMTRLEQNIVGYLLKHNQTIFTGAIDGGHAQTLIARGIIARAARPGQHFAADDVPYAIPDHIWEVLVANKDKITYVPDMRGNVEVYPWRERIW